MLLYMPLIPWSLIVFRLLLAPAIVLCAHTGVAGAWLSVIVVAALISDIYDGVLARRWHCDTPAIRLSDSMVDTVFYLGVLWALWTRVPIAIKAWWPLLAVLLGLEALRFAFDFWKFGKASSYHSYLAKSWGLIMAIAVMVVLGTGRYGWLLAVAMCAGILCDLEGLVMSLILPAWRNDVKTIGRALAIRRELAAR
jgi:phosphatidylglycerophosphate synthase